MRVAAALLAALLMAGPAVADIAPPPAEPSAARETVLAFFENFNSGNVDGVLSTYSDRGEFVWVENGAVVFADKEAAATGMRERLGATPNARLETDETMRVIAVGDVAAEVIAPITLYVKDADGAERAVLSGIMTVLLAVEDGEWRIVSGHTSTAISLQ